MAFVNNKSPALSAPDSIKHRVLLDHNGADTQDKPETFSFVTYNVLADCHAQRDYATTYDPQHISADFRHEQIIQELEYLDGDVICLQEVSPDFYHEKLKNRFASKGFKSLFIKRNGIYDEGCATFYRTDKFDCLKSELIELSQVTEEIFRLAEITNATKTKAEERYSMRDVAILAQLECKKTNQVVTIVNTHVDFGEFRKPDLQILQILCLKLILNKRFGGSAAVLCGDFNMSPDSPQYSFTTEGELSDKQWDRVQEIAQIQDGLIDALKNIVKHLDAKLQYSSMYKHVKGEEPEVTCVDNIYRHCLDYVFYREQLPQILTIENDPPTAKTKRNDKKEFRSKLSPLQILDTLPLEHVLKNVPPSDIYSSDHFPLFVKFAIEH